MSFSKNKTDRVLLLSFFQDSVSDVKELLKKQEDLEAMIQAQSERFLALQKKRTQVCW